MGTEGFLSRAAQASRRGRPWLTITASPRWARFLIAAGAQPAISGDSMTVNYDDRAEPSAEPSSPIQVRGSFRAELRTTAGMVSRYFAIGTPLIIDVSRMREGYAERLVHFAEDLVHMHHGVVDKMDAGLFVLEPRHVASPPRLIEYADPDARADLADHAAGNADVRLFLTVTEVATIMRVSKMTVYRLVHSGELEAVRTGRSFRIPEQAVNSYLYLQAEAVRQR